MQLTIDSRTDNNTHSHHVAAGQEGGCKQYLACRQGQRLEGGGGDVAWGGELRRHGGPGHGDRRCRHRRGGVWSAEGGTEAMRRPVGEMCSGSERSREL